MNRRDKYQSYLREKPPYTMYKTIQDDMMLKCNGSESDFFTRDS